MVCIQITLPAVLPCAKIRHLSWCFQFLTCSYGHALCPLPMIFLANLGQPKFSCVVCNINQSNNSNIYFQNSGSRMKTAGRFKPCIHMGCFDLDTFVELNQRSRKVRFCAYMCTSTLVCVHPGSQVNMECCLSMFSDFLQGGSPYCGIKLVWYVLI